MIFLASKSRKLKLEASADKTVRSTILGRQKCTGYQKPKKIRPLQSQKDQCLSV
jgi:hypothetical protein